VYQKDHTLWPSQFHSRVARMVQHMHINTCEMAHKYNQVQKSHDHLNRCRKSLWQSSTHLLFFQHPFLITLGIEETYFNIVKATYDKSIANIILDGEKWNHFLESQEWYKGVHSSHSSK
jgi:hypothetical protein